MEQARWQLGKPGSTIEQHGNFMTSHSLPVQLDDTNIHMQGLLSVARASRHITIVLIISWPSRSIVAEFSDFGVNH